MTTPAPKPFAPPAPSFGERVQAALLRAAIIALVLSLAFVVAVFVVGLVGVFTGRRETVPDIATLAPSAGLLATTVFAMLAPLLLLLSTRAMRDRAFTVLGFAATFFGLAVLVVFFYRLSTDVVEWFHHMPRLIELENQRLLEAPRDFEQRELAGIYKELNDELAKIDGDPDKSAKDKQDEKLETKKFYENEIIAEKKKELKTTIEEIERAAIRDQRTDTSAPALLWHFLTHGPSDSPQEAGIWPALLGSLWIGFITLLFAVPVGVGAAIYLEEYRAEGWLSRLIQVNINNLAGVPSVVYGILGGFVFVELIFKPIENHQSEVLAQLQANPDVALGLFDRLIAWLPGIAARNILGGGLTLGLLTLPVVIVSAQEAIRAVPKSIREGAIALGATRWQTTWRTVLPMSLPGILTGSILSLSRAIGEAAPLILFGALLLVTHDPSLFSRFTVMPMQIFGWADRPPVTLPDGTSLDIWKGNAAMASVVLLILLLAMNSVAIYLRSRTSKATRG